jgi:hypothetical protein
MMRVLILCVAGITAIASPVRADVNTAPSPAPPKPPLPAAPIPSILLPPAKSPVDAFRELLAMPRAERAKAVASRPPEAQKLLLAKLREYDSLRPDQRELRLKSTELRWYLLPLMKMPRTNRVAQLQLIPTEDRPLVAARLKEWDALPPEVQEELLQNEATLQYFTEVNAGTGPNISPARREMLEAGIAKWRALPEDRRRTIVLRFNQFFELKPEEKAKALSNVSAAERRQMEKALKSFERLPEPQREQCIESFTKFASLSVEERQEFLKNAERWKLMSPEERQSWRELVSRLSLQPPPPPGESMRSSLQTRHWPPPPPAPAPPQRRTNS